MIYVHYNSSKKRVSIKSDISTRLNKDLYDIDKVVIAPNQQSVTFTFVKKEEENKSTLIIRPDSQKTEFSFTTNLPYLYSEDEND